MSLFWYDLRSVKSLSYLLYAQGAGIINIYHHQRVYKHDARIYKNVFWVLCVCSWGSLLRCGRPGAYLLARHKENWPLINSKGLGFRNLAKAEGSSQVGRSVGRKKDTPFVRRAEGSREHQSVRKRDKAGRQA